MYADRGHGSTRFLLHISPMSYFTLILHILPSSRLPPSVDGARPIAIAIRAEIASCIEQGMYALVRLRSSNLPPTSRFLSSRILAPSLFTSSL